MTRQLLSLIDRWGIVLRPSYFPLVANVEIDALSQQKVVVEWSLCPDVGLDLFSL